MKFTQGQAMEMYTILKQLSNLDDWRCNTEYGPYGSYYSYVWVGDSDPRFLAENVIIKIEALNDVLRQIKMIYEDEKWINFKRRNNNPIRYP